MKIPFFKQKTEYTCGPAPIRMILASIGIKKTEKILSKLLKTNNSIGTWHRYMPLLAERYKLDYMVERESSFSELRRLYKRGWKIILCFNTHPNLKVIDKNYMHYSVVSKINWHSIYLLDPYNGPSIRWSISKFKKRWRDWEDNRWFTAIRKPNEKTPRKVKR